MNILLLEPELSSSFWNMPNARRFRGCKSLHYPLGLLTVAALLPPEWSLRLIDLNIKRISEKDWDWAHTVMISGMEAQRRSVSDLIREAKSRGKHTVLGGPFPTLLPEDALEAGSDIVVRGEAENTISELISAVEEKASPRIIENTSRPELSTSPIPRLDLIDFNHYANAMIQTTRGCPFDCDFCDISRLYGRKVRHKSAEQVLAEVEALYRAGARGHIFFSDDNFIAVRHHALELLQKLIPWNRANRRPFGFGTQVSLNLAKDPEMIRLMAGANFHEVFIGIESLDPEVLTRHRKHHNVPIRPVDAVRTINRSGLSVIGSFIIGSDGEKRGVGRRIRGFVEEAGIPMAMINRLIAVPKTDLWFRMNEESRLVSDRILGSSLIRSNFIPDRPESEILEEIRDLWEHLYEPAAYLARAYRFNLERPPKDLSRTDARHGGRTRLRKIRIPHRRAVRRALFKYRAFLILVWRQGVRSNLRLQFWRQFMDMRRRNPTRLARYLIHCAYGEDLFRLRRKVMEEIRSLNRV